MSVIPLSGLCGALIMAGIVLAVGAFVYEPKSTVRPPSRLTNALMQLWSPKHRKRSAIALATGICVLAFTGWPVAAVASTLAVIALPVLTSRRASNQSIARLDALESWTRRLADLLGASRGLEDALLISVRNVPDVIKPEIEMLSRRLRSRHPQMTTELALRLWADDMRDPTSDRIAGALILASRRRGSGLRLILVQLADLVSKDVAARREIEASRAEHRTTIQWVMLIAIGYTVFVTLQPEYSAPYGTFVGQVAMACIAGLYAAGLIWVHRLSSPRQQERLLPGMTNQTVAS